MKYFNLDENGFIILPGFADVHVHLREPGFFVKETIRTGTMAAARGGYTAICSMPNVKPCPDAPGNLAIQQSIIDAYAKIKVYPYGTITIGQKGKELSQMKEMADKVIAFSDDGFGVQSQELMEAAMRKAKSLGKIIVAHCEDNTLLRGGYIHDGEYARTNGHKGICSESEWRQIERDMKLVERTGCAYHVCHISTKEGVRLIRQAKARGLDVTCETAPHYLVFTDMDIKEDGRFKMNPPIRTNSDRQALIEGIIDGTIDIIATDHAPHTAEEKSRGLRDSLMGVVGLETAFPILYTAFVKKGIITLEKLVELMAFNPRKRFGIALGEHEITAFDLNHEYIIETREFLSKGKSTPFAGMSVFGRCKYTEIEGRRVWKENLTEK
ncbi:MAG: dihydroorotase [Eubacteriales bacterium]|nr:dihydroorotase [Eubacteriales bacterium]MDD4389823.1 dihydroorotase [Eubacteriales bacterium]